MGIFMTYNPQDRFFKKAKDLNYAARSVFKLEEIDQKYKLFKLNQKVLDLGAAPGSWSQYASKKIGESGKILGIDLSPITVNLKNAEFMEADLRDLHLADVLKDRGWNELFDVVMSDMAPRTTGIKFTDQARSMELCELALGIAHVFLKPGGHFVCKLFHSDDFVKLRNDIKKQFHRFESIKPESTRKISKEIFLVGLNKKT